MSYSYVRSLWDLNYCMHWITLILVDGLKINHRFEINHFENLVNVSIKTIYTNFLINTLNPHLHNH